VRPVWKLYERWISEIIADFWAVAKVDISSTLGLIGIVSLPRWFVFRLNVDDPHPFPFIRVLLSCAMGDALYPHRQWLALRTVFESFYPPQGLDPKRASVLGLLRETLPKFVALFVYPNFRHLHKLGPITSISILGGMHHQYVRL
jgi:hypothetical protein